VVHEGELAVQGVAGHELVAALAAVQVRGVRARCHLEATIISGLMTVQHPRREKIKIKKVSRALM
jgi:hypothetical protein